VLAANQKRRGRFMSTGGRRTPTVLDAVLLVGSAAVGFGLFQWVHRSMFQGWIWMIDHGLPRSGDWTSLNVLVTCTDTMVLFTPLAGSWTVLLLILTMRSPRPRWRQIWRQPGMAACLAFSLGWCWSFLGLLLALAPGQVGRSLRNSPPLNWAQKFLADEVFMYVGLAVAATWINLWFSGRWRRSADWIDYMGRVVGVFWILNGLVWTARQYLDLL
jgi:hypothetical protein